jgi:endonuclease YncB( thermonuclease family)
MARKISKSSSFITIVILLAALGLWISDISRSGESASETGSTSSGQSARISSKPGRTGSFETFRGCELVTHRSNDGDSFKVRFPDGRTEILRLYFVDAPESAFKTYRNGQNNHERIAEQAAYFDRITSDQAVKIGRQAKSFTLALLGKTDFTVHTKWDSPFNDQRYHAFIEMGSGENKQFLHELLVEKGLARIHTKGAVLPGGTPYQTQKKHLFEIQRRAKSKPVGAWGL